MRKVVFIPDSFKGTMSSAQICSIMAEEVHRFFPEAETVSVPVADGGEGSVDAFLTAMGGERRTVTVTGPYFEPMEGFYGVIDGGNTAVIEMAACAGLPLVGENKDPRRTTTFGVGELIRHAVDSGCKTVILGLGGSATNDGGTGAAAALGCVFYDETGKRFVPVGGTLCRIARIDRSETVDLLRGIKIITMCDIDNPLYGEQGAAYVFAPQKGADAAAVAELDEGLRHLAKVVARDLGKEIATLPGAGAAGGMGGGTVAFLDGELQMGIETVLDTVSFESLLQDADMVFTGEGKLDSQSIRGKVVAGVAKRAAKAGVPVVAVVGDIGDNIEPIYDMGVSAVFSINRVAVDFRFAKGRARDDLRLTMENLMRFLKRLGK